MRLLVANFERQNIVAKSQVIQAVKRLPRAHYEGLQAIRYDPHRTFATHLSFVHQKPFSLRTRGFYYHESDLSVIIIFPFKTSSEFYHVLYHEIGHYVFLRVLSQAHRDQWFHKIRPRENQFVSSPARQNSREDFAETYAYYCTKPHQLRVVPIKAQFFREVVFSA